MSRRVRAFLQKIKSGGLMFALRWAFVTGFRRVIPQRQVLWCVDLTEIRTHGDSLPNNITIERYCRLEEVAKSDVRTLIRSNSELMGSAAEKLIEERLEKGALLWIIKEDGLIAGYRWIYYNDHVNPTYIPQTGKDVHCIGFELFPKFRGRGLMDLFQKTIYVTLRNEGFQRFYFETYLFNKRAVKAFLKTGTRKIGVARRFKFLGRNFVIWHEMW